MDQLFSTKGHFDIVRLRAADARGLSDHMRDFNQLILENEPMYPGIDRWLGDKVLPGIISCERVAYVGYVDGLPAVSAVVKRGEASKFCHLKIREDMQDKHLGEAFFSLMSLESRGVAREIHFTLPESLWEREKRFFTSFGFDRVVRAGHQYRLFDEELRCCAPFQKVWQSVLQKLPKIARTFAINGRPFDPGMLMSVKPTHAAAVLSGKKTVEVRRRFSKELAGYRVSIYASHPRCSIVGDALIQQVILDNPRQIWERFGDQIGCTRTEFADYARSAGELYAIVLVDVVPYDKSLSLSEASRAVNTPLRPPQSYQRLETSRAWAEAVSLGALLQRSISRSHGIVV
jgi:predicted transcriptional regulator/N-acetylglutamate synthase-like GNAT family acetyltransferase